MSLPSHGQRFVLGTAVWFLALAMAGTSCSESHHSDDDDDDSSGESGVTPGLFGGSRGGTTGKGGNGSGGGSAAAAATGNETGGTTGAGGDTTGAGGASGGSANNGSGGNGNGGDTTANAGSPDVSAGAAGTGECTGSDCPPVSVCGNGELEPGEGCDDANALPFDGCSADCQIEPECSGAACEGTCGDGIVAGDEECDDGNTDDKDGCSTNCSVEDGYTCTAAACDTMDGGCVMRLPVVYRDFNASTASGGHPDFQPGVNSGGAVQGLVETMLDVDGKPVLSSKATSSISAGFFHGQTAFAEWYRDDPPASKPISGEIVLWDNGQGGFVNRWGAHGEQWEGAPSEYYCGYGDCTVCPAPAPDETCMPCSSIPTYSCLVTKAAYDGNPLFFPIDASPGILNEPRSEGRVPEQYGSPGWEWESDVATKLGISTPVQTATAPFPSATHNFSFTTEVKFWFRYDETKPQFFSFNGDDDAWLFLNGQLAGDLGGWHVPLGATVTISGGMVTSSAKLTDPGGTAVTKTATVEDFGLENGKIYQIALFQAEREIEGSSFKLELSGLDAARSVCAKE
ncbi:MAG TPA: fibro-slime domain-containing protein [Polyangiaceae bacterium]|nr:fibro-slime domain-containing protein [Polyangiaceae bacterium]